MTSPPPAAAAPERIGLKQGRQIANMSHAARLTFVAEGLPLLVRSALDYWRAAELLERHLREAEVVGRNAEEEAAKALILIDIIRCPPKRAAAHAGRLMGFFYNHLSRLIWADMCGASVENPAEVQHYVDMGAHVALSRRAERRRLDLHQCQAPPPRGAALRGHRER